VSVSLFFPSFFLPDLISMRSKSDLTLVSFEYDSGQINIDRANGTKVKTVRLSNRRWRRVCGNGDVMAAVSSDRRGVSVFTSETEEKQFIEVQDVFIESCAVSPDGRLLILGAVEGETFCNNYFDFLIRF